MPLSRQTSRIVWPSKPSTTRPSTSIRMRGDDCGRCGDCVSSRRSASDRSAGLGAGLGARDEVSHGSPYAECTDRHRDRVTDAGWAGAAKDVVVELGAEVSHPAGRAEGSSGARGRTGRTRRCRPRGRPAGSTSVGSRPALDDAVARSRPGAACRCGTGWSCRRPRRRRTASAGGPGRRCRPGRRRRRRSRSRCGRRPRAADRSRRACRAGPAAAGRPTGRRPAAALTLRPCRHRPAELDDVAQRRAERDFGDALRRPASGPGRGPCPGCRRCRSP